MGRQPKKSANAVRNTVLFGVLIVGLALVYLIYSTLNQNHLQNYAVIKTYDGTQVQKLQIDAHRLNVHLHTGAGQQIAVQLVGRGEAGYELQSGVQGDQLHVEVIQPQISLNWLSLDWAKQNLQLEVTVPQKEYDQLNLTASSGNVALENVQAKQDALQVSSGNLQGQGLHAQSIGVISRSGNIQLADVQGNATVQASSGNIRIEQLQGAHHVISANSGNLELQQVTGDVQARTTSGNIELHMSDASSNIDANANSGNVHVYLPANANFQTDLSVSSGDIRVDFPVQWTVADDHYKVGTVGSGGPLVKMQASSGNLELLKQ